MEKSTTFLIELVCPGCGRTGTAHASAHELPSSERQEILLDQVPFGFALTEGDVPQVRCECGKTFEPDRVHAPK
jgi:hypothetical protein